MLHLSGASPGRFTSFSRFLATVVNVDRADKLNLDLCRVASSPGRVIQLQVELKST